MISARQLAGALHGLRLLLRFDGRAWEYFEKSPAGFWASFSVAAAVAPFYLLHAYFAYRNATPSLGFTAYAVVEALSYVISWTLFPFAMLYASRLLKREQFYFWHLVPYNWFQLPVGVILYAAALLADLQILPGSFYTFASATALLAVAIYTTFIAAVGLRVPVGTAMSLMVMDLTLTFLADALISRI